METIAADSVGSPVSTVYYRNLKFIIFLISTISIEEKTGLHEQCLQRPQKARKPKIFINLLTDF